MGRSDKSPVEEIEQLKGRLQQAEKQAARSEGDNRYHATKWQEADTRAEQAEKRIQELEQELARFPTGYSQGHWVHHDQVVEMEQRLAGLEKALDRAEDEGCVCGRLMNKEPHRPGCAFWPVNEMRAALSQTQQSKEQADQAKNRVEQLEKVAEKVRDFHLYLGTHDHRHMLWIELQDAARIALSPAQQSEEEQT